MQRWGISESRLPPGSEIMFRNPTAWEQYRAYILAVIAAILIQSALIFWLLYEHWRRQRAEVLARNTMSELTHVNRMATVSQLSASIAHEVRQPLAGILANAQAALRWLERANVEEVRQSLDGIVSGRATLLRTFVRCSKVMCRRRPSSISISLSCRFWRSCKLICRSTRFSEACSEIPYSTKQGIFAKEQGICTREQGI
jgi:hypothetical protein